MQITNESDFANLEDNKIIGKTPKIINSVINFNGKNNILFCEDDVVIKNSRIDFNLDNSILYLSSSYHPYVVNISLHHKNVCFIGKNNFFNSRATIVLSEEKNVIIGSNCLFSYDMAIRVADSHVIYSSETQKRLNYSKSVYIGDHVWFGQNVMILKGTSIGSGAIVGAGSVISNKEIPSNTSVAGNPAKVINKNIFWIGDVVHGWDSDKTEEMAEYNYDYFVYKKDEYSLDFKVVENDLNSLNSAKESLDYIQEYFLNEKKNRFTI